jgi:hypothetical protein
MPAVAGYRAGCKLSAFESVAVALWVRLCPFIWQKCIDYPHETGAFGNWAAFADQMAL